MSASETKLFFFSVDSDHSLAVIPLTLSLNGSAYVTATYETTPPPTAVGLLRDHPVPVGRVRYWWSYLLGPARPLVPTTGLNKVRGSMNDGAEILKPTWDLVY